MSGWLIFVVVTIPFVVVWVAAIVEVIRRPDLGRLRTVAWGVGLLLVPLIAVAAYVVARTPPPRSPQRGDDTTDLRATRLVELAERRQAGTIDDATYTAEAQALR